MIVGGINIRVARCATFSKTINNPEKTFPRVPPHHYIIYRLLFSIVSCRRIRIYMSLDDEYSSTNSLERLICVCSEVRV